MKIKLNQRVQDTETNEIIEPGTVIERSKERGKDFLPYGEEIKEDKPKAKAKPKK